LLAFSIALTDREPLVEPPDPPGASQAGAVRDAAGQLFFSQPLGAQAVQVRFTAEQLAAISSLANDGFKPDRFLIEINQNRINIAGSHKLVFGRWLNASLVGQDSTEGFPPVHLTIGSISFPEELSRFFLDGARQVLNFQGANLPPLDTLIQSAEIKNDQILARIHLPLGSSILDRFPGVQASHDAANVLNAYCRLTELQSRKPTDDLAIAIQRAFPAEITGTATASSNRAALVALAMFDVSPRVGELVGLSDRDIKDCAQGPAALKLNGRFDLSEHWSLSAALAVTTGVRFSEAMGQWKELADSVSKASRFAEGDPTGFSFLDIAADRSGFRIAKAAMDETRARLVATAMSKIGQHDILPVTLMNLEDGLPERDFVEKYGTIRDPRFRTKIQGMDDELHKTVFN
jgi:hypothetical protein